LTSCASYTIIKLEPEALHKKLKIGDAVKIMTKDGKHSQFRIIQIEADSLFGRHQTMAFNDIAEIKKINSASRPNMIAWRRTALMMLPLIIAAGAYAIN
jgi:predicted ABC-class ATPase